MLYMNVCGKCEYLVGYKFGHFIIYIFSIVLHIIVHKGNKLTSPVFTYIRE